MQLGIDNMKLIKLPPMKMEEDEARNKTIREIENPNTNIDRRDKLSIIIFKKRIKFLGKKTSFNTACCWVCYNIAALTQPLNWVDTPSWIKGK